MVTAFLLTPRVTVVVNDLTAPDTIGRVDNVPVGLALPLYLITGTGYTMTTAYEDIFHFPDERAYTKTRHAVCQQADAGQLHHRKPRPGAVV